MCLLDYSVAHVSSEHILMTQRNQYNCLVCNKPSRFRIIGREKFQLCKDCYIVEDFNSIEFVKLISESTVKNPDRYEQLNNLIETHKKAFAER
jgi:hypothetical protein